MTKQKLLPQSAILFKEAFKLLIKTLKFNDENIKHEEVRKSLLKDITFRGYNVWILICSIVICSIGLNSNSTAVVIGAMLISPLMGPILGVGLSIGTNDLSNLKESLKNFLIALGVSLLTSTIFFLITPLKSADAELLARTTPTFLDALVAIFGGLAGVIAMSRKDASNVIPGVAIATALMPPICTAGYGLANGNMNFFLGALYLFLLNSVFISIATLVIVRYLRFPLISFVDESTEKKVKRYIVLISSIIIIPSAFLFFDVTQKSIFDGRAKKFTKETIIFKGSEMMNANIKYNKNGSSIEVFMIGKHIPDDVIWAWEQELIKSDLKNTILKVVQNKDTSEEMIGSIKDQVKSGIIEEMYHKNYQDLQFKNTVIDSLNKELYSIKDKTLDWMQLKREIFTQYPDLKSLSFGKSIQITLEHIDTIPTLIPIWTVGNQSNKLKNWLEVRTGENNIHIVSPTLKRDTL
ncbi:MAG: hypothetical protein CMP57_02400 [Flavobacteriales bacterium]|nr:hypothetical protein [Flavobacteriales bacterium]